MDEMENRLARLPGALLPWYRENRRVLPWREEVSAYRTWVSEIMLQQTRVAAVIPYFQRFMAAYPTVEDLAACDEGELMRLWAGLGYYSRARNLRRAAQVIAEEYGGAFPRTYQQLMALPGVRYVHVRGLHRRGHPVHRLRGACPGGGRQCAAGVFPPV